MVLGGWVGEIGSYLHNHGTYRRELFCARQYSLPAFERALICPLQCVRSSAVAAASSPYPYTSLPPLLILYLTNHPSVLGHLGLELTGWLPSFHSCHPRAPKTPPPPTDATLFRCSSSLDHLWHSPGHISPPRDPFLEKSVAFDSPRRYLSNEIPRTLPRSAVVEQCPVLMGLPQRFGSRLNRPPLPRFASVSLGLFCAG